MSPATPVTAFLASTDLFGDLDEASIADLAAELTPHLVTAGTTLLTEGEPGDAVYVVVSGRLRVFGPDGTPLGEVGGGEIVGEMALLTDQPRTATVRAVRDTHLLHLPRDAFLRFTEAHPRAVLRLAALVVRRQGDAMRRRHPPAAVRTVAVLPAGTTAGLARFTGPLVDALTHHGPTLLVGREHVAARFGDEAVDADVGSPADAVTARWLDSLESSHRFLVYECDPAPSSWTRRCVRQADRILAVGDAAGDPRLGAVEANSLADVETRVELVLVHATGADAGPVARGWLRERPGQRHHHVRAGAPADFARLARSLAGASVGLVLSGGGARGFAHIGVIRALREAAVPVDVLGGSSFGAVVAGGAALGLDDAAILDALCRALVTGRSALDPTLPMTALTRGRRLAARLRDAFGDVYIEDLWHPFFAVASNLSQGEVAVHRTGLVWQAVRSSLSIPGLFPPMRSETGDVLVDGSVMDNLPVDVMRTIVETGPVLAVDLRAGVHLPAAHLPEHGDVSGWWVAGRRVNPFQERAQVPGIVPVLVRTTEVSSVLASRLAARGADLTFSPPVERFALLDFRPYEAIVDAGYQHAVARLAEWQAGGRPESLR